ncbi:MAG: serine/threonine protein kinase, partial [Chromatiaceae bacterium]|nr:serine/threonine protein kinase [Chromatiaceae bacterium]
MQLSDDKTQLGGPEEAIRCCPKCGAINRLSELPKRDYRCGDCGLELAHLDTTAQGIIRGVLSWLRAPGEVVHGRYRITGILGKGGFGATYLIEDELLHGKRRALKEIPELLFDEYEARLLGRLNHPAIPDITDRFSEDGTIYLVLEFGGTRTLRGEQERRGGRIPLFVLLPWIRQLCAAIRYLHQQTPPVVHRDLKPENILLDDEDRVMLIDFGIAKEAAPDSATRTLGRAASQGFSPPEQVLGTGTDERSDVYALGAIVYNLLSGQLPAAAYARVTGASIEPLRSFLPEIPPAIEAVVLQALELNINLRPQSVEEFARVFEQLDNPQSSAATQMTEAARGGVSTANDGLPSVRIPSLSLTLGTSTDATSVPAPAPAPASSRLGLMLLALIAVAGLGGGTWWLLNRLPPEPEPAAESASGSASGSIAESASTAVEASPGTAANPDVESAAATPVEPEETAETGAASA